MDMSPESPAERFRRGDELLARGRYAEGFALLDAWREIYPEKSRDLPAQRWRGEPLNGERLLIVSEQGYGDQIMFARFAKLAQAQGAAVAWLCPPALERLFNRCLGIPAASPGPGRELGEFSRYCPSSALPNGFFPPLAEPPAEAYITPPPAIRAPGLSIGVVPSGNPGHVNDSIRSLPAEWAAELLALPGAVDLRPESSGARDFYDTACVIAGLDLVISVDSSVAHLAGAMGKPVWVLLPHAADWRWQAERADSPWYPSARLFRQPEPGDWRGVVEAVTAALQ